jgi:hypothetical protein
MWLGRDRLCIIIIFFEKKKKEKERNKRVSSHSWASLGTDGGLALAAAAHSPQPKKSWIGFFPSVGLLRGRGIGILSRNLRVKEPQRCDLLRPLYLIFIQQPFDSSRVSEMSVRPPINKAMPVTRPLETFNFLPRDSDLQLVGAEELCRRQRGKRKTHVE